MSRKKKQSLLYRPEFLLRLSVLLKEGYTFYEALRLLLPHHMTEYEATLLKIDEEFRKGFGVAHILSMLGFHSKTLLPIVIAEVDGRLAEAFTSMGNQLKKIETAQERLKKLLAYPIVLFVFITGLLLAFRKYFLPNMEALIVSRNNEEEGFLSVLPMLVVKIPDLIIGIGVLLGLVCFSCYYLYKKLEPKNKIRFIMDIPILGNLFLTLKTRAFASELGSLLESGLPMQNALDVLVLQRLDVVLSEIAVNVKKHVIYGEPFHSAVGLVDGLTKQFSSFAQHGSDSGHLAKELIIYSEQLDEMIDRRLESGLAMLQPLLFSLIAICILAAYIALLLPVYGLIDKV
ncbi:competence type IV pilus assembly protein ComGB [Sporosarcina siberiensis]|uniref:Competence type IV pilus assembly protein ComGB n=1 Tax=Sporosarcina siberiensis TaxID=1365606 RepID=A0ABW4SBE8_9BACL